LAQVSGTTLVVSLSKGDTATHSVRLQQNAAHPTTQTDVLDFAKKVGTFNDSTFSQITVTLGPGNATVDLGNVALPTNGISIDEGAGTNTLIGPAGGAAWAITGADAGTIGSLIRFRDVEKLVGSGAGNSLTGLNTDSTWTLTGANAGSVDGMLFTDFTNLVGGTANDTFVFQPAGSVSGTIIGGGGTDTLNYSAYSTVVKVDLRKQSATAPDGFSGTATATAGFSEIDNLVGSDAVNTLTGSNLATVWSLTGTNRGSLTASGKTLNYTLDFQGFANLAGGSGQNSFKFIGDALVTGWIDAGSGSNNTLDYSAANYPTTSALAYSNFAATTGLALNGASRTKTADGTVLRMVNTNEDESNSAFSTQMVSATSFSTTFQFRMTNPGGIADPTGHVGADGLVFVLQNGSPANSGTGGTGGSLGLDGRFPDSVGIAFDTWQNTGNADSSSNELGIDLNGSVDHDSNNGATKDVSPNFDNGKLWQVWVTYDGTTLAIYASDTGTQPSKPTLSEKLNLAQIIGSPFAFAGFTAATGEGWEDIDVLNWQFNRLLSTPLPDNPGVLVDFATVTAPAHDATGIGAGFSDIQNVIGSAGSNDLRADGAWQITAADAGTIYKTDTFHGFQNLEGTAKASTFTFSANASLDGTLFTGNGNGKVILAPGVTIADSVQGGTGNNTLVGSNANNTWTLTGANAGTVDGIAFSKMANLVGGSATDTFAFQAGGSVSGSIDGGGGGDWLDYSAYNAAVTVNLATGSATGVDGAANGAISHIQDVLGSSVGNKLTGNAQGNILVGGAGADTITGGSGRSLLIGSGGNDTITGGPDQDIVIGGSVTFVGNQGATLMGILAEWQRTDETFAQRVANIRAGVGPKHAYQLVWGTTVLDDGASNILRGNPAGKEGARDWFFANLASGHDTILDLTASDIVN